MDLTSEDSTKMTLKMVNVMGINLHIQQFKEKLANAVNDSKLPPTIVQMVLNEITAQVNMRMQ